MTDERHNEQVEAPTLFEEVAKMAEALRRVTAERDELRAEAKEGAKVLRQVTTRGDAARAKVRILAIAAEEAIASGRPLDAEAVLNGCKD